MIIIYPFPNDEDQDMEGTVMAALLASVPQADPAHRQTYKMQEQKVTYSPP